MRAGTYLALFALVPIIAASAVSARAVLDLRTSRSQAASVQHSVERYVQLSKFRNSLSREHYYVGAAKTIADRGLDPAQVKGLIGIDIARAVVDARIEVDQQVADLDWMDPGPQLRDARTRRGDLVATLSGFAELERTMASQSQRLLDALRTEVRAINDSGDLAKALDVVEAATVSRQAVTAQLTRYFSVRFAGGTSPGTELLDLVKERSTYRDAVADMERLAAGRTDVAAALGAILTSPEHARFLAAVDGVIGAAFAGGWDADGFATLSSDLRAAADDYMAGIATASAHMALIDVAADDIERAIGGVDRHQEDATTTTVTTIAIAAVVSIVFAFALGRTFGRPLRSLATEARAIGEGRFTPVSRPSGPAEVRAASLALHAAGTHLQLVEDQALALARGDLSSPVLHRPAAGVIGASLQEAVRTLAESLTEREEFRRRLVHEASHDGLTQLLNRNSTLAHLESSLATMRSTANGTVALLFIDLDGFKEVNDEHGHQAGDSLLRNVAQRLATRVRERDHVGRLGGDEFVVIAEHVQDEAEIVALAQRLLDAIALPLPFGDHDLCVGASIGVALASGSETTADELLRDADIAVYHAKDSGKHCIQVCTDELRASIAEQAHQEHAIRRAIANDEFVMHFQPIVLAGSRSLHGFESLVRWDRPGHGLLAPDGFVPFAERSDLVLDLDRWVLRRVARQLAGWQHEPRLAGLSVAVNISGRTLGAESFVDDVLQVLDDAGVDPSLLVIEVTESALPDDLEDAADKLRLLRRHGVRTAIDDFGTGYTSLAHLKTLPVDQIKIDRSFTNDESSESLVKLIIDTGHLLGATILAEGVETDAQATRLTRLGSDALQGYFFGRPCAAEDLAAITTA